MQKKIVFFISLLLVTSNTLFIYADTAAEIDKFIDFYKTMNDFNLLQNPEATEQSTDKIVLLVGTISIIDPSGSFDFLYTPEEILNPSAFVAQFKSPKHEVIKYLTTGFSARTKTSLAEDSLKNQVSALIRDINTALRKNNLYKDISLQATEYPPYTQEFIKAELSDDELAFLNRLLLDKILKDIVAPVTLTVELIRGEWYGYERVESYTCIIRFSGPPAFRIFNRRKSYEASDFMIPLNSRVLLAATPEKVTTSPFSNKNIWLFKGLHVRKL